jgi:outer membrane immunogenic protein
MRQLGATELVVSFHTGEMGMRKVLGLVGATLLLAGPALAADLSRPPPVYKAPPLAPVFSWTGWYIGANAGYGWGSGTSPVLTPDPGDVLGFGALAAAGGNVFPSLSPKGFIGGGQIGYDWQVNTWVLGLVADFQGADIKASGTGIFSTPAVTIAESLSEKLNFLGTGRVRLGWAAGNWLFYGSGGVAYGNVESTINVNDPAAGLFVAGSRSETRVGWAAGGGVNYALTPNWIVGVDYLHYDLGHTNVTGLTVPPGAIVPAASLSASQNVGGDIVRGVINYKF